MFTSSNNNNDALSFPAYQQLEMSSHSVADHHRNEDTEEEERHNPMMRVDGTSGASHDQLRQRNPSSLRLEIPDDIEAVDTNNTPPTHSSSLHHITYSLFNRDVKAILDGITKQQTFMLVILFVLATFVFINFALLVTDPLPQETSIYNPNDILSSENSFTANKIAFGSCSSYDLRDMSIFTDAIIPAKPDAWIWTGDFVYLDDSEINCEIFQPTKEWQESCNCTATWFASPPYSCHAGDVQYAKDRWLKGISNGPYQKFLQYMCPKGMTRGEFPPNGLSPLSCDRPIYGIYDDHDFGGNNANGREVDKDQYKNMFLDAVGVPQAHPRRGINRGAWYKHTLNRGKPHMEVDIILLDERYERMSAPCDVRREYCEKVVFSGLNVNKVSKSERVWCEDFLQNGPLKQGHCCSKDEDLFFKWCMNEKSKSSPYYREICDVTYDEFGMRSFHLLPNGDVSLASPTDAIDEMQSPPFCDVLGKTQRRWLRQTIKESTAAVTLFVSSSVLFSNPTLLDCGAYYTNSSKSEVAQAKCRCSTDDWDCYRVAQQEMFHLVSSVSGCSIVVTGDYHFSDIKKLIPKSSAHNAYYHTEGNTQTIYQIMASGLSDSTARTFTCESYRKDPLKLRTHPECSYVQGANYGRIILEHDSTGKRIESIKLQILSGKSSEDVILETVVDPTTCNKQQHRSK